MTLTAYSDRCLAHLRAHAPDDSDLGLFFRAGTPVSGEEPKPAMQRLGAIRQLQTRLHQHTDDAVLAARRLGATWEQIGASLGMSRQAAHERWGRMTAAMGWNPEQPD